MKQLFLIVSVLFLFAGAAKASDECMLMGQKNPHGMAMVVSQVSVMDSVNFVVSTVKAMPFTMGKTDTVWFSVCPLVHDGKMHNTQIKYMTDMGPISYAISVMAPVGTCKRVSQMNPHPMDMNIMKVWVSDSINFHVTATKAVPFTLKNGTMISFDLCLTATDGMPHTTTISFATNMGTYATTPQTLSTAGVSAPQANAIASVEVFPNPATSKLTARLPDGETQGELVLYSISGQRILSTPISGAKAIELSVGAVSPGAYFLRLESSKGMSAGTAITIAR
ncbi:MAG: T9SS type A sorting domain-containing protein [Candidatus Kapaibacterium sp.]|jgi:hypothetical protein